MEERLKRRTTIVGGLLVALVLLGALVGLSDLHQLGERLADVRWAFIAGAALAGVASYVLIGPVYRPVLEALGDRIALTYLIRACFVATAVSRNVKSAGVAGIAVLAWVLGRHGARPRDVLTAHLAQLAVTNTLFIASLAAGVGLLAITGAPGRNGQPGDVSTWIVIAAWLVGLLALQWWVLLHGRALAVWSRGAGATCEWVGRRVRRPGWGERVESFFLRLGRVCREMLGPRGHAASTWAWAFLRLAFSLLAFWLCVRAVGLPLSFGVVLVAYGVGKFVGLVSLVPAGLGLIEGSLVGVLAAFGVDYEAALVVALLNRLAYHVVPALVAVAVAGGILKEVRSATAELAAREESGVGGVTGPGGPGDQDAAPDGEDGKGRENGARVERAEAAGGEAG